MKDQDRVALARIVLTNREHIIAIEPLGKACSHDACDILRSTRRSRIFRRHQKTRGISKDMIDLARHILDSKAAHFDPSKFKDEYENALKTLVRRKAAGKPVKAVEPEERPDNVISLMDALQQSLKGKASAKRAAHFSGTPAWRPRPAKKAHRPAARARKAGEKDSLRRPCERRDPYAEEFRFRYCAEVFFHL